MGDFTNDRVILLFIESYIGSYKMESSKYYKLTQVSLKLKSEAK